MELYKAIKYIRLSYTDDKTVESDSVANQRRLIDDFVEKHPEIEVVAEKIDDGYSGVLFDRPAFQEMMDMIKPVSYTHLGLISVGSNRHTAHDRPTDDRRFSFQYDGDARQSIP